MGRGSCAHLDAARLYSVAASGTGGHVAECILSNAVSAAAAASNLLARHSMVDVIALNVLTTVAGMLRLVPVAPKRS